MSRIVLLSLLVFTLILTSCEGSDTYRGTWKALDAEDAEGEIVFTPDKMTVKKNGGDAQTWEYSQNSFKIEGGTSSYGIKLENGLRFKILFPLKNNTEKGVIADQNDQVVFTIGRSDYYSYEDIFGVSGDSESNTQN